MPPLPSRREGDCSREDGYKTRCEPAREFCTADGPSVKQSSSFADAIPPAIAAGRAEQSLRADSAPHRRASLRPPATACESLSERRECEPLATSTRRAIRRIAPPTSTSAALVCSRKPSGRRRPTARPAKVRMAGLMLADHDVDAAGERQGGVG